MESISNKETFVRSLKAKQKALGLSDRALSEQAGLNPTAVRDIYEKSKNLPRFDTLEGLANVLGCTVNELVYDLEPTGFREPGEQTFDHDIPELPVLGYLGAGDEVNLLFDDFAPGDGMYTVKTPPGCSARAVGLEVRGNSMYPAYDEGDIVFYERDGQTTIDQRCIGRQSVVKLVDGRIYLKRLSIGPEKGLWTLESFNAPPIKNVDVEWAALVKYVQKKY